MKLLSVSVLIALGILMLSACQIAQKDLSDFFRKWGFKVDESVYTAISDLNLPAPTQDLTALRD